MQPPDANDRYIPSPLSFFFWFRAETFSRMTDMDEDFGDSHYLPCLLSFVDEEGAYIFGRLVLVSHANILQALASSFSFEMAT